MKKERIKNFILALLVICSLFLTGKIWLNENLWPDGYNFFSMLQSKISSWFNPAQPKEEPQTLLTPEHLIAYTLKNSDHASIELSSSSKYYTETNQLYASALADTVTQAQDNFIAVEEAEWQSALSSNGLYADYGYAVPSSVFCSLYGGNEISPLTNLLEDVHYVILTAESNVVGDVLVYLRAKDGACYKTPTAKSKSELTEVLNQLSGETSAANRFSFFIGADVQTRDMGEVLFDSYLLLTENETTLPGVTSKNPLYEGDVFLLDQDKIDYLLRYFSMNPKSAKRYTDADGSIVYLQNQATLKLFGDGRIEYAAAPGRKGFALLTKELPHASELSGGAVSLIYNVYSQVTGKQPTMQMNMFTQQAENYIIHFDYYANGHKIVTDLNGAPAATIELRDGYVQRFSFLLRTYTATDTAHTVDSTYSAVDNIFTSFTSNSENAIIENTFIGYYDDGKNGEKKPSWFVKLKDETQLRTQE